MQIIRIDQIQNLLKSNPNDSFLRFALAKEYEKLGQINQSIQEFESLKSLDANYVGLYYHLGKNYEREELMDKAIHTYKQGILIAETLGDNHAKTELEQALYNAELL